MRGLLQRVTQRFNRQQREIAELRDQLTQERAKVARQEEESKQRYGNLAWCGHHGYFSAGEDGEGDCPTCAVQQEMDALSKEVGSLKRQHNIMVGSLGRLQSAAGSTAFSDKQFRLFAAGQLGHVVKEVDGVLE